MISSDAGVTSSSIISLIVPSPMPTLSPALSLTLSPVSTTSGNLIHRPFGGDLRRIGGHIWQAPRGAGRCRMDQERRHFTDEFKTEAVALLTSSGRPLIQIARELGISPLMLRNWRNRREGRNAGSTPHPRPISAAPSVPDPAAEISRLRRENDGLRMERDILKNSSRGFVPPVAVETGGVSLAAERKRPSASWWR